MMKSMIYTLVCFLTLSAFLSVGGCGASDGGYTTASLYPTQVESICIDMTVRGDAVYRRNLETRLTEAIVKQVQTETSYVIRDRERADSLLRTEITEVRQNVMAFNPDTGNPIDKQMTFVMNIIWLDLDTGEELVNVQEFTVTDIYIPPIPLNEDFFGGSQAVIEKASRRIVEQMRTNW